MSEKPLHQFISDHRDGILARCVQRMKQALPERSEAELADELPLVLDEIIRALQRDMGLGADSPLPGKSEAAMRHGSERQRSGYPIARIALDFGTISDTVGQFGVEEGMTFGAREYQVFNQCIDSLVSSSIEQFSRQEREQRENETTERVGFLAHELRNALSSGRAALGLLKRGEIGINSRTGAVLERSLVRAEALINQTLLAVQLRAGVKPDLKCLRVSDLLQEVAEGATPERNVRLTLELDLTLEVEADERLLVSAISNLVQNALKFTHEGGTVILRGRQDDSSIIIEVEDECGGLPTDDVNELLKPYVQRSEDRRGLGLGLAITLEAIQAHGGELGVTNLPSKGCVFAIKLRAPDTA